MIDWDDFKKIEMCTGTIIEAIDFVNAKKAAYILTIDFGDLGIKKSSAQITKLYLKEDLIGKQIIAVTNLPPKQIANFFSECLVLGMYNQQNEVVLLQPEQGLQNGARVA